MIIIEQWYHASWLPLNIHKPHTINYDKKNLKKRNLQADKLTLPFDYQLPWTKTLSKQFQFEQMFCSFLELRSS